jgi:hypothetical protein
MKLRITYGSLLREVVVTDHASIEAYCNEKFGSAHAEFVENGGTIEVLEGEELTPTDLPPNGEPDPAEDTSADGTPEPSPDAPIVGET